MNCAEEFVRLIPDKSIRDYITETVWGDPFSGDRNYYVMMDNIVNLAFIYAFSCFTEMRNHNVREDGLPGLYDACTRNGNANSLRVIHTFEKIYTEQPIRNELIQFILFDIQFDFQLGVNSRLRKYLPSVVQSEPFALSEYFSMINTSRLSSRYHDSGFSSLDERLLDLIRFFPFLSNTTLFFDEKSGWYSFKINNGQTIFPDNIVHTYGIVNRIRVSRDTYNYVYLASIDKGVLRYENINDSFCCKLSQTVEGTIDRVIKKPYVLDWDIETVYTYLKLDLFRNDSLNDALPLAQIYNINYKYIKYIALAISDALGLDNYKTCYEKLKELFPSSFVNIGRSDVDNVVLMMLIQNSPYLVLKALIGSNSNIAYDILLNLKNRLGSSLKKSIPVDRDDFEQQIEVALSSFDKTQIEKSNVYKKMFEEYLSELKTNFVLSFISSVNKNPSFSYSKQLSQGLESLESESGIIPMWQKICTALGSSINRLTCFYSGVIGFGEIKKEYDAISEFKLPDATVIQDYQKKCIDSFKRAASEKWDSIKNEKDIIAIINNFLDLCKICESADASVYQGRSRESLCLYAALGKYSIIDPEIIKNEIQLDHINKLSSESSAETIEWWRNKAIRILRFLSTGSFNERNISNIPSLFLSSINPTIASYYRVNSGADGYDYTTFFLTMDANGNNLIDFQYEIGILSEFSYDMNKKYYCLPNILRVSDHWWVDPLLIECDVFDDIFRKV